MQKSKAQLAAALAATLGLAIHGAARAEDPSGIGGNTGMSNTSVAEKTVTKASDSKKTKKGKHGVSTTSKSKECKSKEAKCGGTKGKAGGCGGKTESK